MADLWAALAATDPAAWMRVSRWGYAGVNAGHILGVALLVGAIVPLDLRLLGVWKRQPLDGLACVLVPVAATGLALAAGCGALLFLAGPADYAANPVFLSKMALVLAGAMAALWATLRGGVAALSPARGRAVAVISLLCWLSALVLGRLIAFTMV
ncbi:hypothetical protein [Roseospira navarrensis]|uniref:DUF2214 domain-containing protein n=1 Tax=Roseospira navarrensis TaxID=140058 RepID=A0A7X1ZBZ0_9PROT|nr:hypothetical protein [Roseospira navarrensis]MQX35508.1 hypothetical protein [Roseospira navarrensis]